MTERWNTGSALGGGFGGGNLGGGSINGGSNGVGNIGGGGGGGGANGGESATTFSAANWESRILRKIGHGSAPESFDDLLVFGYSCKVFRDDERARFIDQGRHLIPWMGDNQLKIDRYDARGALHDLAPYEPPPGGYVDRLEGLSAAEQKAEKLCEEERYYSLYKNEVEEEYYQEEALKRQTMLGNQVPFNYDAPQPHEGAIVATVEDRTANSADEQDDDPYVKPKNFDVPPDIPLPERMKEHAIIEKTAKFIASQDAQMEILLKTKQANNPQFEFLTQGTRLFRYYRHVLLAFRTNQYPTEQPTDDENGGPENGTTDAGDEDEQAAQMRPKVVVPPIKYKPSVDCAYTQLISKITGAPIPTIVADDAPSPSEAPAQQLTSLNAEESSTPSASAVVEVKKVSTGLAGLVQYDSDSGGASSDDDDGSRQNATKENNDNTAPSFAPFQGVLPPITIQHVIDRTAIYVAKNGYSFEKALRVKNDPRFVFLNHAHEYYPYYAYLVRQRMAGGNGAMGTAPPQLLVPPAPPSPTKVTIRMETENGTVVETTPSLGIKAVHTAVPKALPVPVTNIQHQKLGAPVSFSLVVRKAGKEDAATAKAAAGLGDESDDEQEGNNEEKQPKEESESDRERTNKSRSEGNVGAGATRASRSASTEPDGEGKSGHQKPINITSEDIATVLLEETVDPAEIITQPVAPTASVAPKQAVVSKEKQAERKKRANMFLNLIKRQPKGGAGEEGSTAENVGLGDKIGGESSGKTTAAAATEKEATNNSDVEDGGSIHSVHSTSPSPVKTKTPDPTQAATTTTTLTTIIEDDDDDDVVIVSETRPAPARSRSRHARSRSKTDGDRRAKKKKSKSRHRSTRGKKKSKKKSASRSRSASRARSDRSRSRNSRSRKRHSRSRSRSSRSRSSSVDSDHSRHGSRSSRVKRASKRAKRSRSGSRRASTPEVKRTRKRSRSADRKNHSKEHDRGREARSPDERKRKRRSRSRSARRKNDSDTENRHHRREHRRKAGDGYDGYDERYPPTRGRYWDC